jgi:hypothetical protein
MIASARSLRARSGALVLALGVALLGGCGGEPTRPRTLGSVSVMVTTTGSGLDGDGYSISIGSEQAALPVSGSTTLEGVAPGSYEVTLSGVAPNCSVLDGATRTVTVAEAAVTSVTFEVECVFDGAGAFLPEVACSSLSPGAADGMPLDIVPIGGVPSDLARPILARMSWSGGHGVSLALVDEQGVDVTMMIPLHPSGSPDGGEVTVRISDETQTCPPFTFSILPMPTAEGELADLVDVAQALLDEQAELLATTREQLLGTPMPELEPALRLEAIAQTLVNGPAGGFSLRALAEGTAPDFSAADLDFVERLLARTGLRADLEASLDEIQAAGPTRSGRADAPARALSPGLALECVTTGDMDAQLLHDCMTLARDKAQGSASEKTQDKAIFAMDVAAMVGSRRLAGAFSSAITFSQLYDRALADNLPSSFVSLSVTPEPADFLEDQPGPGTWAPALATAVSNGWDLNELLGELIVGKVTPDPRLAARLRLSYLEKWIITQADPQASTFFFVENFFQGLLEIVADEIGKLGVDLTDGLLTVPPLQYGPVDVSDTEWTDSRVVTGTSVTLVTHEQYDPQEPGTSLLEVITAVGKFGGTSIATEHVPVSVGALSVSIEPSEILLQPGRDTTLTVTVSNAVHPDSVELDPDHPAQGTAELSLGVAGTHTVTYTAPDNPVPNSTDLVAVRHIGLGGARGPSSQPRSASAIIRFGGIRLLPVLACVSPGQEVQLEWELTGFDTDPELHWSASGGDVSSTGLFTAPGDVTSVTVTVTVAGQPGVQDSIEIPIGGCVCSFSVQVGGNTAYVGQPGDVAEYFAYDSGDPGVPTIGYINFRTTVGRTALFGVDIEASPATGPGSYPLPEIGGNIGYEGGPYATYGDDGATLVIYEFEPHTRVTGEVVGGLVHDSSDLDITPFSISAAFQIYPPAGPGYGTYTCEVRQADS